MEITKSQLTSKERIQQSPNFRNGAFQNLVDTPMMPDDVTYYKIIKDGLRRPKSIKPPVALPSVKTNLKQLTSDKPVLVWFGHSSYLIHINGINLLIDPVFSGRAAPVAGMVKAFDGANTYSVDDMPDIDIMIITHNHYDHLDKKTIKALKPKTKLFVTSLGVGKDIEGCYSQGNHQPRIIEMDWLDSEIINEAISITSFPARHFSGRGIKRGGSLWSSFGLKIFGYHIFIGGDSGYGTHFKSIGEIAGKFDMALLECGQYNTSWPNIHMMPEQTVQAAIDLKAAVLMPVHWGKFALANHPWNEPINRLKLEADKKQLAITTPKIGEPVIVGESFPKSVWWDL